MPICGTDGQLYQTMCHLVRSACLHAQSDIAATTGNLGIFPIPCSEHAQSLSNWPDEEQHEKQDLSSIQHHDSGKL